MIEVSCALIIKEGKVLVTQNNASSDHPLQWEFPGGKVKPGESAKESVIREIMEELELNIFIIENMIAVEHDYGHKKIKLIPFICQIESGTIKLNDHAAYKWANIQELYDIDFSEADKRMIQVKGNQQLLQKHIGE